MFSQILKLIPRLEFEALVKKSKAEYAAKGLTSWAQFVAMLFCQLGRAHSLREIEGGLKSCEGKLAHLGIEAPARSSLSYANAHRPWQLFEGVFHGLFEKVATTVAGKRRKFRFKNKLVSIDSTVIDLSLSMFDWAKYQRTKGAVKLHLVLDHDGYLPCFGIITDGTVHDVKVAQQLRFAPGTIVVDDRGYNDYRLFGRWCAQGVFFVTRMKVDARYEVVEQRLLAPKGNVVADQIVHLSGEGAADKCPYALRRVEVLREDTGETLVFVTNLLDLSPVTIAAIYKDRWQIELFFKALKQNLKIKTFVGTSANAVKTQIWIAVIVYLLVAIVKKRLHLPGSLHTLLQIMEVNLFEKTDIIQVVEKAMRQETIPEPDNQLNLFSS